MTPTAVLLISISAFTHAFWNLLGKRRRPSASFFLIANSAAALALSPLLWQYRDILRAMPDPVWLLLLATGVFQTIYFIGLAGAYRTGDISLAYPLARSIPVILVAFVSLLLGRSDEIGTVGLAGMLLVALGCLILPLVRFHQIEWRAYITTCTLFALMAALGTTGYTMIDDEALRQARNHVSGYSVAEVTIVYVALEATSIAVVSALLASLNASERKELAQVWRNGRLVAALTGLIIVGTYGLVLMAMSYVSNVSYVAAFRQFSIPIGAILGMTIQGEPRHPPKIAGILLVFAGLVMAAIG